MRAVIVIRIETDMPNDHTLSKEVDGLVSFALTVGNDPTVTIIEEQFGEGDK